MESKNYLKKLIKESYDVAERVSGYILTWESNKRKATIRNRALMKIQKKGSDVFTRSEKVAISEWANEFGQQCPKIILHLGMLNTLLDGTITIRAKKYPNLNRFVTTHKFYPPLEVKII